MLEQTVNIRSAGSEMRDFFRIFSIILISCVAFILSACVPVGNQQINTTLFKNKEDMKTRTASLKPGMTKKEVFERINIDPEKFSFMSTEEVQMSIYGNSQVHGTPDQLEQFKKRLLAYEGFSLPYRNIKGDGSIGFGGMKVNKNGYDLKLVLIFEKNRLLKASVDGNQAVNEDENSSIFNVLLKKGIGLGF